ncbi:MAG: septal ring lytic transglycosylase RlpA family protein [Proteobacteria bacterium]|nr:septal ring lytic transglycosylase RlpA family protein [Pseudomonadota bacterium]
MRSHNRLLQFVILLVVISVVSGCAETELLSHWAKQVSWPGQQESKGVYKVGEPYKVGSVWYYPEENFHLVETGIASWYGPGFHEGHTSNGEVFDQSELTAAHRTLQLPSLVRVTNLENGRSVVVRVNDRGPFLHGRIMDVSQRAAELLGFINKGTARVRIEVLEKESRILAEAAKRGEDTTRMTVADLNKRPVPAAASGVDSVRSPPPPASDTVPESLRTPTITVEALKSSTASPAVIPMTQEPASPPPPQKMAAGHMQSGHFMPDPIVSTVPVSPTGIFVQAGSFAVYSNAERLAKKLVSIAPTIIEPVTVNTRKMYRVKLGPIASVEAADEVLEKVIHAGMGTAKVVKNKKK